MQFKDLLDILDDDEMLSIMIVNEIGSVCYNGQVKEFREDEPLLSLSVGKMSTRIIGDFSYNRRSSSTKIDVTLYGKDYKVENHELVK